MGQMTQPTVSSTEGQQLVSLKELLIMTAICIAEMLHPSYSTIAQTQFC